MSHASRRMIELETGVGGWSGKIPGEKEMDDDDYLKRFVVYGLNCKIIIARTPREGLVKQSITVRSKRQRRFTMYC